MLKIKEIKELNKAKKSKEIDVKNLAKPLFMWFLILLIPVSVGIYFFLGWDDMTISTAIFLGIILSALGSVLVIATFLYIKDTANPMYGQEEDFKQRNGYYPKTKYHAYVELWLRAIRAFAVFYAVTTPILNFEDTRLVIGTLSLCTGIFGLSSMLIKKTKVRPDIV